MGKLRQFAIMFDDNKDVFEAGQCIKGHVAVDLTDDMKMRGLWLLFHGRSHVEWEQGSGDSSTTYQASETYFRHEVTLFGKARDQPGEPSVLPSGRHVFPFQYLLPPILPCSFEGEYGYVRYVIKGTIDKPWKFNHTTKRAVTVLEKATGQDSQEESDTSWQYSPIPARKSKTPSVCCASGPVDLQVHIDRATYCPGEEIVIRGNVDNNGSVDVSFVEAKLVQLATFHGNYESMFSEKTKTKTAKNVVQKARIPGCKRGQSLTFAPSNGAVLRVPPLPPSSLKFCKIIDLEYYLSVKVHLEGTFYSSSMKTKTPIRIKHSPQRVHPWSEPSYTDPPADPAPPTYTPGASLPPSAAVNQPTSQRDTIHALSAPGFDFPPPSYAESMLGATNIKDNQDSDYTMGDLTFAPKYTYYDWSKHGQQ